MFRQLLFKNLKSRSRREGQISREEKELNNLAVWSESGDGVALTLHYSSLSENPAETGREVFMKNWNLPVYIGVAALLSACGAATTSFQNTAGSGTPQNNSSNVIPNPNPTQTISSDPAALAFSNINVTGAGGTNPTYSTFSANGAYIQTDNELKVRVVAEPGSSLLS